jgi:NitT/TauT family transport system ATP-binding protein
MSAPSSQPPLDLPRPADAAAIRAAPARSRPRRASSRVRIEHLTVRFGLGAGEHVAVEDLSLEIAPGEFVCILGPSGCGKSTLLNATAGYVAPDAGRIIVDGEVVTGPGPDRGMVFQQYSLFPWKTVLENVAFGPRMTGRSRDEAQAIARAHLEGVGLSGFASRYPGTLSGGMQQRVGLARALANAPGVLLMDEPFGALDAQTRSVMQELLLRLWSEVRNTCVFITHDIDEAIFLGDRVVVMSAAPGRVLLDQRIDMPRPRTAAVFADPWFLEYKRRCVTLIRDESLRAFEFQGGAGI